MAKSPKKPAPKPETKADPEPKPLETLRPSPMISIGF
jgi:hypothetical protein